MTSNLSRPQQKNREARPQKMAECVAESIRQRIAKGKLKEGDQLPPESVLIAEYGVSRPSLREAFRILEAEGLVTMTRGVKGGAVVHAPNPELIVKHSLLILEDQQTTIDEIHDAFMAMGSPVVLRLASQAKERDIDLLNLLIAQNKLVRDDVAALSRGLMGFYYTLIELAGNRALILMTTVMLRMVECHLNKFIASTSKDDQESLKLLNQALDQQSELVEFIARKDAIRAEELWFHHMKVNHKRWLTGFEKATRQDLNG